MTNRPSLKFAHRFKRQVSPPRLLSSALLVAALVVGCGDGGVDTSSPFGDTRGTIQPTGTPDGGPVPVLPTAIGTTGTTGQVVSPAVDAGAVAVSNPGRGGLDTPWCKVKKILDAKCVACHTTPAVGGAPFPLSKYEDLTAPHPMKTGKKVYERLSVRVYGDKSQAEGLSVMPPGAQLPADQLAIIDAWIAAGAPAGENPTCAGAPASTDGGSTGGVARREWPLKECDAVYKITSHGAAGVDSPYMAPAGQEVQGNVTWDAPWGDEKVQAIAFKTITDNSKVLHHWILYASNGAFLTGWAPGEDGVRLMRDDIGMDMPTGKGSLRFNVHYYNTMGSSAEPDKSGVEVCVVKEANFRKNKAAVTMGLTNFLFSIPAGAKGYEVNGSCTLGGNQPVTLLSASPHAHKLARRMVFKLTRKSGETVTMHDMPFMFGDQKSFPLEPPVVVQPGDTISTTCMYDNETGRAVTFGETTGNEMCFNFALYYPAGALSCGLGGLFGGGL